MIHYFLLRIKGKISFPREMCGKTVRCSRHLYRVFLHIKKEPEEESSSNKAYLRVTFMVKHLNFIQMKLVPLLSIPFFSGFPGFLSKMFCVNETNNSLQGLYEWESREAAEGYISSYPMKFMKKNAIAGSVEYEISTQAGYSISDMQHYSG